MQGTFICIVYTIKKSSQSINQYNKGVVIIQIEWKFQIFTRPGEAGAVSQTAL